MKNGEACMIKVLVVDDSPVAREFLTHIFNSDPDMKVIGTAKNGEEAVKAVTELQPDVVTMDIHMPKMNGFESTLRIMETRATPVVVVSATSTVREVTTAFRALEAGALAIVPRPTSIGTPEFEANVKELVQTVKLMSEVKVVKRLARYREKKDSPPDPIKVTDPTAAEKKIIAVGSSTGGPIVIKTILSMLPKEFSVPLLIVQHIATGFLNGFVEWLDSSSNLRVHVATQGGYTLPGHVYFAPDDLHMSVDPNGRIWLSSDPAENNLRPSISYLFRSIANVYGENAIGVLLTGMGRDGAQELKLMREKGAITIAQDKESSVVFGMPGEAVNLGAAVHVLPPEGIALMLKTLGMRKTKTPE
jgi:two-component system chemotaxis response regulator CheB